MMHEPFVIVRRPDERGSALLGVILLLMLMSALAAALSVSGETETLISRNQRNGAQAHAAAEAGLNHAVDLALSYIFGWRTGAFGSASAFASTFSAIDALLAGPDLDPATDADNGGFDTRDGIDADMAIPLGTNVALSTLSNVAYTAFLMDDDATAPAGHAENGDVDNDLNDVLIIRATGTAPDNTTVTLEAVIGAIEAPGIISNGNITIGGNFTVSGSGGGVHANGDLDVSGSADIEQNATASGSAACGGSIDGYCGGGQPAIPIPEIRASDYRNLADYVLTSDGRVLSKNPTTHVETEVCAGGACTAGYGWSFGGGTWSNNSSANGTFFVEGNVSLQSDMTATLFVEGSVDVSANSNFTPNEPGLFMVIDGDLEMTGGSDMTVGFEGSVLVHEQVRLRGNTTIRGQLIIENAENNYALVDENDFRGTADVIYNGGLTWGGYGVRSWREVR
jgi:hypothetical protein